MKRAFFPGLNQLPIVRDDIPVPRCGDGEVLLRVKMGSICNLTDTHTISGLHPPHHLWAEGHFVNPPNAFPAPVGHEGAAEILEVGRAVKGFKPGDRVCTVHISDMFSEFTVGEPRYISRIPENMSWDEAAPIEMLTCVIPLIEETVRVGDTVAILGQGASGLMATQCAKIAGAREIIVFEPKAFKRKIALELGASQAFDPCVVDPAETVLDLTHGEGVNTVIECVGIPETIKSTTKMIGKRKSITGGRGGTIGVFGACRAPVEFDFMELHWKGGRVFSVGGTEYGATQAARERAVDLVASGLFRMKPLLTHKFPLSKTPEAFDMIMNDREPYIKVLIDPAMGDETRAYRL